MDFGRMITAMVTPFDENDRIHWPEVERLIDYLIEEQQNDSLVVCGTTGESPTLTDEEKLALFRYSVEKANGRARIIAGTGSNNTAHSVHMTKLAEEAGVDGILAVVPYYNKPSQEGLYRHFKAIADSTPLPVIVYNVPGRTVASLSVETTLRLAEIPNIVATKECASVDQMSQLAACAPESFRVYSGDDPMTLPLLAVGGYGIISVASHLIGAQMKKMIELYLAGQPGEAARLHQKLYPVFKGLFEFPNPVPVKYALQLKGFDVGGVRLPLVEPTESEAAFVRQLVESID
ncbi:4-hydroxy-tetrahydrodipicolinate synthase [Paenibacillus apiarius]|uniref:4-hydroxy-tetrahydrodipicolinate synthase n=1 Tax=Paenibacillus apiarius TaxID=46240 RepID=A0ABT4DM36_9BACL|nr:4-hydroxy-tetrahydrodipicolinate synthase [Paenibacillus apiarius]MCY9516116.1 4-hydroxy-tetrahydrodipicolinate synthase [Paenibacillus apiarius]MCY9518425.1 4-hydroxy-tetrahydrodipicolinate synthase [Paenibacillus apiarius]MCY9551174.1 4-hydroxy-tetrahydrodipicolinate synthase [Paenibacillus apiarius]MCY9558328.1 4-hydroxy-tetrahydrodipicolinate synthase [Paenibacillus apiarius]MCY9684728.1 4-hydroxy-tetrahydrodipicolinate synthase [Paenibacillus apiarius]